MEKFLDSLSKSTKKSYRRGLELFIEFYGKDVETILAERKDDLPPSTKAHLFWPNHQTIHAIRAN